MVEAVRLAKERVVRLEKNIEEFVPHWRLAPVVEALQALRGISLIVAVSFVTEIGDLRRFENPRQLMGYLGLTPGAITKAGNGRVRQLLVESAWTYRYAPRIGAAKLARMERVSPKIREIAWKAQTRLTARYRALMARGKKSTVVCTAIARELAGFMWAVAREVPAS
jgi:transposase